MRSSYAIIIESGKILLMQGKNKDEFVFPGGEIKEEETLENGLNRILKEKNIIGRIRKKIYVLTKKKEVSHFFLYLLSNKNEIEGEWIPIIELRKKEISDMIIVRNLLQDFEIHGESLRSIIKEIKED